MRIYTRAECGLAPPRGSLTPFQWVDGLIVHYVGTAAQYPFPTNPTLAQSMQSWRNIQAGAFANTAEGYIDVPYNHAIDLAGNCLEGRGWDHKSGANGSANYNGHALAVCVLAGVGQATTPAALQALLDYEHEAVQRYSMVSYVKKHSEVAPNGTACPGDIGASVPELQARLHDPSSTPLPVPPAPKPPEEEIEMVIYTNDSPNHPAVFVEGRVGITLKSEDKKALLGIGVKEARISDRFYAWVLDAHTIETS